MVPESFEVTKSLIELNESSSDHLLCMMKLCSVDVQPVSLRATFPGGLIDQIIPQ